MCCFCDTSDAKEGQESQNNCVEEKPVPRAKTSPPRFCYGEGTATIKKTPRYRNPVPSFVSRDGVILGEPVIGAYPDQYEETVKGLLPASE